MEYVLLVTGLIILLVTFFDFFHTTLSGRGFWYISAGVNGLLTNLILRNKSRKFFDFSGLIHLLATTFIWLFLLILGTFIIFCCSQTMVVNAETLVPADTIERFYYTCFLLSTLGVGDFIPGNQLSRILTGILSFSGFILLTTALTYLLSVVNSVLNKKELALSISSMGKNLQELYIFLNANNGEGLRHVSSSLRQGILKSSSNFLAFPIIDNFMTRKRSRAAEVQLARMYEVLKILREEYQEESFELVTVKSLISAIQDYTSLGIEEDREAEFDPILLDELRSYWFQYGKSYKADRAIDVNITTNLSNSGWSWYEVYDVGSNPHE